MTKSSGDAENGYGSTSNKLVSMPGRSREACAELKQWLIAILSFTTTAAIAFIVIYAIYFYPKVPKPPVTSSALCLSEDCVNAAGRMISARNESADPCEDFYEYACGNWIKEADIPSGNMVQSIMDETHMKLKKQLRTGLEEPVSSSDVDALKKVKEFYDACVKCANCSMKALKKMFDRDGGWPVLSPSKWDSTKFNLERALGRYHLLGASSLWLLEIFPQMKNSSVNVLTFLQPKTSSYSRSLNDKLIEALKVPETERRLASDILNDVVDFEARLATIFVAPEEMVKAEITYVGKTLQQMTDEYAPTINFTSVINYALVIAGVEFQVTENEPTQIIGEGYFKNLSKIILSTNQRTLASYIMLRAFLVVGNSVPEYAEIFPEDGGRDLTCVDTTNQAMPHAVARIYADLEHLDVKKTKIEKAKVYDMFKNIRESFKSLVNTNAWLSKETISLTRDKADVVQIESYYPDYVLDDTALNTAYAAIKVSKFNYSETLLRSTIFSYANELRMIRQPVNKKIWARGHYPLDNGANYLQMTVALKIPAASLRSPFYNDRIPMYLSYGGIGFFIGHEFSNGFDSKGRKYNKNGSLVDWWPQADIDAFEKKATCFVNQFNNYTEKIDTEVFHVNGKQTLGENIADISGLKESYTAYERFVKARGHKEDILPGLNLNQQQLFFLSFAQAWCQKETAALKRYLIEKDVHSPGRFRVIGSLSNTPEFAEAFSCKTGSKMNPADRCSIW